VESKDKFRDRGTKFIPDPDKKLMEQARECLRYYHYSYRTEQSYLSWIFRYIRFFGDKMHPRELNAIAFFYRDVLTGTDAEYLRIRRFCLIS